MTDWLRVEGLCKRFGDLEVLRCIGFTLAQAESLAVLGPSGCGKTTLLRILIRLEAADAGSISRTLNRTGYLPQGTLLFPWKRVIENIELPLRLQGVSRTERRERIGRHLATFGLAGFERAYPHELSGGMQQRAALLRAVSAGAQTLLLDEPFGALDTVTRHHLQDWLALVREQLQCTLVFVTHDLEEAVVLAQRVLVLSQRPASVLGDLDVELSPEDRVNRLSAQFLAAKDGLVDLIVAGTRTPLEVA